MEARSIRTVLSAKRRAMGLAIVAGFGLFVLGQLLAISVARELAWVGLAGFLIAFGVCFFAMYGIKCPRCRGNVGAVIGAAGGFLAVPKKLRYCPYCGVDFDAPVQRADAGRGAER